MVLVNILAKTQDQNVDQCEIIEVKFYVVALIRQTNWLEVQTRFRTTIKHNES